MCFHDKIDVSFDDISYFEEKKDKTSLTIKLQIYHQWKSTEYSQSPADKD